MSKRINIDTNKGFTRVYNDILKADLPLSTRTVYAALASYCYNGKNECFVHQRTIAQEFHISLRSVNRAISELKAAGLIIVKAAEKTYNACTYILSHVVPTKASQAIETIKNLRKEKRKAKQEEAKTTVESNDAKTFTLPNGEVITLAAPIVFGGDYNIVDEIKSIKTIDLIEDEDDGFF